MIGGGGWNSEPCGVRYQRRVRSYRQKCQSEIAAKAIETVLPPRHKLQQLEIIGSIGAHPGKVHAPKDIETFKGLLAELGAGWRVASWKAPGLTIPVDYIELIERTICKLSKEAGGSECSKSAEI